MLISFVLKQLSSPHLGQAEQHTLQGCPRAALPPAQQQLCFRIALCLPRCWALSLGCGWCSNLCKTGEGTSTGELGMAMALGLCSVQHGLIR